MKLTTSALVALVALCARMASAASYDVAAYVWPAYQPLVPLWGYENDADPKVMERKIDAAVSHGVNVFIYDWYWYGGRPFLEDALRSHGDRPHGHQT